MEIRLWGTRGSIPVSSPSTIRYGGNTSCVEVRLADESLVVLDAGSGIRALGAAVGACTATVLLSHYHWDHIQGFPFFGPAYLDGSQITVFGPEYDGNGPRTYIEGQMCNPYFPAPPSQLAGIRAYHATPPEPFTLGDATVRAARTCHPAVTLGYRIEEGNRSFVYISDNEVDTAPPALYNGLVELAHDADRLLHDCQYTEAEYAAGKQGWGHSTPRSAVQLARDAGARTLLLFHHDPAHTDEQLEAMADHARELAGGMNIVIAREGERHAVRGANQPVDAEVRST